MLFIIYSFTCLLSCTSKVIKINYREWKRAVLLYRNKNHWHCRIQLQKDSCKNTHTKKEKM